MIDVAELQELLASEKVGYDTKIGDRNWNEKVKQRRWAVRNRCKWCGQSVFKPATYHQHCLEAKQRCHPSNARYY